MEKEYQSCKWERGGKKKIKQKPTTKQPTTKKQEETHTFQKNVSEERGQQESSEGGK